MTMSGCYPDEIENACQPDSRMDLRTELAALDEAKQIQHMGKARALLKSWSQDRLINLLLMVVEPVRREDWAAEWDKTQAKGETA